MGISGDFLLPGRRPLVQGHAGRSVDVCDAHATGRLQADSAEHPRSRVLASVPGTRQATEGVLLASIPRTARVNKKELKAPDVIYQGDLQFKPIDGSKGVQQAVNTDKDIVTRRPLLYVLPGRVVHVARRDGAVGSRIVDPGAGLHHPCQLAGSSRHLRDGGR